MTYFFLVLLAGICLATRMAYAALWFSIAENRVVPNSEVEGSAKILGVTEAEIVAAFGFVRVELGRLDGTQMLATECECCGAPIGSADPDKAKYIRSGVCRDCRF